MSDRGRPTTHQQERETRWHSLAKNAVLALSMEDPEQIKVRLAAARRHLKRFQRQRREQEAKQSCSTAPPGLAKTEASHLTIPVVTENVVSFLETGETGADMAPLQSDNRVLSPPDAVATETQPHSTATVGLAKVVSSHRVTAAGGENVASFFMDEQGAVTTTLQIDSMVSVATGVAAARGQPSRAVTQEVLTSPYARCSVYGENSRVADLEARHDEGVYRAGAMKQPSSTAPRELASTPVVDEKVASFFTGDKGDAAIALPQVVGGVPGVYNAAAARQQHNRAAAQEVLMMPRIRCSVYGREIQGIVLEGQFDDYVEAAEAGKQSINAAPHEVLTLADVRSSGRADEDNKFNDQIHMGTNRWVQEQIEILQPSRIHLMSRAE